MPVINNLRIGARLALLTAILIIPMVVATGFGLRGMGLIHDGLRTVYEDRAVCLVQLDKILDAIHRQRFAATAAVGAAAAAAPLDVIHRSDAVIDNEWHDYSATYIEPTEEKPLADKVAAQLANQRALLKDLEAAVLAGDQSTAKLALDTLNAGFETANTSLSSLIALQARIAQQEYQKSDTTYRSIWTINLVTVLVSIVAAIAVAFIIVSSITSGLGRIIGAMRRLTDGDYSVAVAGGARRDEVGDMARAVQIFKDSLVKGREVEAQAHAAQRQDLEQARRRADLTADFDGMATDLLSKVGNTVQALRGASDGLNTVAVRTSEQSTAVAAAAEKASANVQTVAAATDELSATTQEISRQVQDTTRVSQSAVSSIHEANVTMRSLTEAARKIGDVVGLISSIANQTNLLALNATIEAARAGEAGRGFAVVATEVKALATQTARATEEIESHIKDIQDSTQQAVAGTERVTDVIGRLDKIVAAIASAVEQQHAATREITSNINEAASANDTVTRNTVDVSGATQETSALSGTVNQATDDLRQEVDRLKRIVEAFLGNIRAA